MNDSSPFTRWPPRWRRLSEELSVQLRGVSVLHPQKGTGTIIHTDDDPSFYHAPDEDVDGAQVWVQWDDGNEGWVAVLKVIALEERPDLPQKGERPNGN